MKTFHYILLTNAITAIRPIPCIVVGAMIGSWILSGTVPAIIYYGIDLISPSYFYISASLVCAILSFSIGSETYTTTVIGISEQSNLEVEEESDYDLVVNGSDGDDISHGNNHMYGPEHVNNTSEGTETWTIGNSSELQLFEPGSNDQAEKINGKGGYRN